MVQNSKILLDETKPAEKVTLRDACRWCLGAFLGIAGLGLVDFTVPSGQDSLLLTSAFGASAVLVFGNRQHFFAQPRSLVGGHVLSALAGVLSFKLLPGHPWLAAGIGTAAAIAAMQLTKTLHPPGGGTALFAVIGPDSIHNMGFSYVIAPAGAGALFLLFTALLVNNIASERRYPEFWIHRKPD
ncbi:HPP family protein [Desulfomonile tiedjei]|uniref:CBS-domain-containing membrane protein n=1 Tax=Desulfomonile tiedjei (strain ATCC 49306 / DSM 6799 / DCB-1) TaxID=706587 RepID=I4CEP0_DESTA|nr:HPP family protein [Desulfomonile tiedjei]AFM28031.1 CBS-domain-containing membrane protein [Desulfomonile tiedjei DSM 6799]